MTPEEFRRRGHEIIDWLADYHAKMSDYPVQPATQPGDVKAMLPASPPIEAEGFGEIIADLDSVVLPNISHWQHPRFFGYFPSNSLGSGILGDLVSSGLGVLGLSWQSSPAVTEIEEVTVDWFRQMVGLSSAWFGVINDTASTSTLVALLCAREKTTGFSLVRQGLQAELKPLTIYTSASAHSSVEKRRCWRGSAVRMSAWSISTTVSRCGQGRSKMQSLRIFAPGSSHVRSSRQWAGPLPCPLTRYRRSLP